jgi:hypothetical protein
MRYPSRIVATATLHDGRRLRIETQNEENLLELSFSSSFNQLPSGSMLREHVSER